MQINSYIRTMNRLYRILAACAVLLCGAAALNASGADKTYAAFQNPDMRYRPFVRWWWNGDRVEADELVRELRLLKEAGLVIIHH